MKIHEVFIDTNIYDASNYSFGSPQYSKLTALSSTGLMSVLINSVVDGEVRSHISVRVRDAVKSLNEALNDRVIVPFRYEDAYQEKVSLFNKDDMIALLMQRFDDFLHNSRAKKLSANITDTEKILSDYFMQNPPFENKKPDEFKDAISIQSITEYVQSNEHSTISVVTKDKGFKAALENADVKIYDDINSFLDMITTEIDKQSGHLREFICKGNLDDEIIDQIRSVIDGIDFSLEEIPDEFSVVDVSEISFELQYIDSLNAQTADIVIEASATVKVWSNTVDEDQSCFDKEDWQYLWKVEIEKEETHKISFELMIHLDTSGFSNHTSDKDDSDYSDDEVVSTGFSNAPTQLLLDEDSCIEVEVISETDPFFEDDEGARESAYSTCPDCGAPIGLDNDGGNGFCSNCAWNH